MPCRTCGSTLAVDSKFCQKCGNTVIADLRAIFCRQCGKLYVAGSLSGVPCYEYVE